MLTHIRITHLNLSLISNKNRMVRLQNKNTFVISSWFYKKTHNFEVYSLVSIVFGLFSSTFSSALSAWSSVWQSAWYSTFYTWYFAFYFACNFAGYFVTYFAGYFVSYISVCHCSQTNYAQTAKNHLAATFTTFCLFFRVLFRGFRNSLNVNRLLSFCLAYWWLWNCRLFNNRYNCWLYHCCLYNCWLYGRLDRNYLTSLRLINLWLYSCGMYDLYY